MKRATSCALLLASGLSLTSSAWAFSFGDAAQLVGQLGGGQNQQTQTGISALNLISALSGLDLSPQQALGGTGALLAVAQNQLPQNQYAALLGAVPGVEKLTGANSLNQLSTLSNLAGMLSGKDTSKLSDVAINALGNVQTMNDANKAFSALGMDPALIAQFAPLLLQYLGTQGANSALANSLASVWGVQAQ